MQHHIWGMHMYYATEILLVSRLREREREGEGGDRLMTFS